MLVNDDFNTFTKHMHEKYSGRLIRIERWKHEDGAWKVGLVLHIPEAGIEDELTIYQRINRVIEVVCTGNEPEPNNVSQ